MGWGRELGTLKPPLDGSLAPILCSCLLYKILKIVEFERTVPRIYYGHKQIQRKPSVAKG
jgi:hypothetical protein